MWSSAPCLAVLFIGAVAPAQSQPPTAAFGELAARLADVVPWRLGSNAPGGRPLPSLRVDDRDRLTFARIRRSDVLVARGDLGAGTVIAVLVPAGRDHDILLLAAPSAAALATATLDLGDGAGSIPIATGHRPDGPFCGAWSRGAGTSATEWNTAYPQLEARLARWQADWRDATTLTTDPPQLADDAEELTTRLLAQLDPLSGLAQPLTGDATVLDQLGALIGLLQTGRHEHAGRLLRAWVTASRSQGRIGHDLGTAPAAGERTTVTIADPMAACWLVVAHYWYLRATHDVTTIRSHWSLLETCVKQLPRHDELLVAVDGDDGGHWRGDATALFLHAVACIGGAIDSIDRLEHPERWAHGAPSPRPGAAWSDRFLQLLTAFEARFWNEDLGRFVAGRTRRDDAAWPDVVTGDLLLPAWSGMLTTTGDRTLRNVRTVLAAADHGAEPPWRALGPPFAAAARVSAEVLVDGAGRFPALQRLLDQVHAATTPSSPWQCGLALDAIHHATIGLRITTGPGIDEDWVRIRPAMPPGHRTMAVRNLRHDGWLGDLWLEHRHDPLDAEELATNDALPAERRRNPTGEHPRTRFTLVLRSDDPPAGTRLGVVHCNGTQFQDHLRRDQPMTGSAFFGDGASGR